MRLAFAPRCHRALTLIEAIVVVAVLALAVALLLPAFARVGPHHPNNCLFNLRQIGLAFRTWEGDYGDHYPMSVPSHEGGSQGSVDAFRTFQVMSNELNNPKRLICPTDTRKAAANYEALKNSNLSYFVGLDADETRPTMFLTGDRNLVTNGLELKPGLAVITTNYPVGWSQRMHHLSGYVGLADGSVQYATNPELRQMILASGTNTNRLAMP